MTDRPNTPRPDPASRPATRRRLIRRAETADQPTKKESTPISAKERDELRRIIRARSKALKLGIEERKADQRAEVERQINTRFAEQRAAYREVNQQAAGLVFEFNQGLQKLYAPLVGDHPEWGAFAALAVGDPPDLERQLMRRRADREVEAAAKAAQSRLAHWEADALEAVARSGIESDQALALLDQMSSIEMLMPMVALPATAEVVVTEMVTSEGKMPWLKYGEPGYLLEQHSKKWRHGNALAAAPAPEDENDGW